MSRMVTSVVLELVDRVTRPVRNVQQALSGLSRRAGLDRLASQARAVRAATGDMVGQFRTLTRRLAMIGVPPPAPCGACDDWWAGSPSPPTPLSSSPAACP